jgi:hypothetical protein
MKNLVLLGILGFGLVGCSSSIGPSTPMLNIDPGSPSGDPPRYTIADGESGATVVCWTQRQMCRQVESLNVGCPLSDIPGSALHVDINTERKDGLVCWHATCVTLQEFATCR